MFLAADIDEASVLQLGNRGSGVPALIDQYVFAAVLLRRQAQSTLASVVPLELLLHAVAEARIESEFSLGLDQLLMQVTVVRIFDFKVLVNATLANRLANCFLQLGRVSSVESLS